MGDPRVLSYLAGNGWGQGVLMCHARAQERSRVNESRKVFMCWPPNARLAGVNPFRTAVPFWGQSSLILGNLSPKRDRGSKRFKSSAKKLWNRWQISYTGSFWDHSKQDLRYTQKTIPGYQVPGIFQHFCQGYLVLHYYVPPWWCQLPCTWDEFFHKIIPGTHWHGAVSTI